ncbi:hypothetical protein BJ165DRAFT_1535273 [Panaeolus papilionaceus]|nr:hypothetical protein BJ165DRAFT_1535273 [Panaeolus papilionaceus]
MNVPELSNLKVNGEISVETVASKLRIRVILGPTGVGKSCFIQVLAGDVQDLGLSKDQLAGFTQHASACKLINVWIHRDGRLKPIFLIDTPGFSDPRISYLGVVRAWGHSSAQTNLELGKGLLERNHAENEN